MRDAWDNSRVSLAWTVLLWIAIAVAVANLMVPILVSAGYFQTYSGSVILGVIFRALVVSLQSVAAILAGAYAFTVLSSWEKTERPVSYRQALAGLCVASIPYAAALTVAIPLYAVASVLGGVFLGQTLLFYSAVIAGPAQIGAVLLALAVYRNVTGKSDAKRLAAEGIAVLVAQGLAAVVVGLL